MLGRAANNLGHGVEKIERSPCISTGPIVREDGTVGPCCSGLAYEARDRHPFEYGNASEVGLLEIWRRWRDDQLLRVMRLTGFEPLNAWLQEEGLALEHVFASGDVCENCVAAWRREPGLASLLRNCSSDPRVRAKLDELESFLFGDVWTELSVGSHVQ
jgi:hypothetical protein